MKVNLAAIGLFVVSGLLLFSIGLFVIGNRHKAFSHHLSFYTDLSDVNGVAPGTVVRVSGFDAGQVQSMQIPDRPSGQFRLKLKIDDKLRRLIRNDSMVTVESDGLVGDKFLLIHQGTDRSAEAADGATLSGKEQIEISAVIAKATGVIDQASAAIGGIQTELTGTLKTVDVAINNANGLIDDARHGKGPVGVLLNDQQTAAQLKQTVANADEASNNINQLSVHAGQLMSDVQSRSLPAKIDDTIGSARQATQQLNQASRQINTTLVEALGPDRSGETAADNIRETLSNVNLSTVNVADDTEALKHEFLFRGYFRKRGFYSLQDLTPEQYRANAYFQNAGNRRLWLAAQEAFAKDANGAEMLTPAGQQQVDQLIAGVKDLVIDEPIVVEGYSTEASGAEQIIHSRSRSLLMTNYLEKRFHFRPQDIGVMALNATPPPSAGKSSWDGVCLVILVKMK